MKEITIQVPEDSLLALKWSSDEAGNGLRMAAAIKLYEMGRLSSGAAAGLAGVPRVVFLSRLADYGVTTFQLTEEDLQKDHKLA